MNTTSSFSFSSYDIWRMLVVPSEYVAPERLAAQVFSNELFTLVLKKGENTPPGFKSSVEIRLGNHFRGLFPRKFEPSSPQKMCMLADLSRANSFMRAVATDFNPSGWEQTTSSFLKQFEQGIPGVIGLFMSGNALYASLTIPKIGL